MNETIPRDDQPGTVFGLFKTEAAAAACFDAAAAAGLATPPMELLASAAEDRHAFTDGPGFGERSGRLATGGVGVGGAIGAAVGTALAGIAAVAAPVVGVALAVPIASALAGGGVGMVAGGMLGGLAGLGINQQDTRRYDAALAAGEVCLRVKSRSPEDAKQLQRLMIAHRGEEVAIS